MGPVRVQQPDERTIEGLFQRCILQMDLPPDKLKILRDYPMEKKWEIIRDQDLVCAKNPPSYYVTALKSYMGGSNLRFSTFRRKNCNETSAKLITGLEISLRTNNIEWVDEFLSTVQEGLDVLVDYLKTSLNAMRETESSQSSNDSLSKKDMKDSKKSQKMLRKNQIGDASEDVRLCVMCLKAIMNNQNGFNMVLQHSHAISYVAYSLCHKNFRAKSLILELLAAVCLVEQGHDIILKAFDNFRIEFHEWRRFETLMNDFRNLEEFNIDFMVSCMQFINIVVHSVQDMNFRVSLQHEFLQLGLDEYLVKLQNNYNECDRLQMQIQAYLDNCIDVGQLLDDSETKTEALIKVAEFEEQLSIANERLQELENDHVDQIATLQKQLQDLRQKADSLEHERDDISNALNNLKKNQSERSSSTSFDFSAIPIKSNGVVSSCDSCNSLYTTCNTPPSFVPPPPPLGPPPPLLQNSLLPPPLAGKMDAPVPSMTIRRKIETKYRLPSLNWITLKPQQVRGTIFNELDDEKYYKVIDFNTFEELFKTGSGLPTNHNCTISPQLRKKLKIPTSLTLLDGQRQRNLAIARRKLDMPCSAIVKAINNLDLNSLCCENVEILQHFVPSEMENRAFQSYIADGKDLRLLSKEDQFLYGLSKVERLSQKLAVMSFIGNFNEFQANIQPQLNAVIAASMSVKNSEKLKKLLEIVLAFGNYMNSSKRGPVYGFKLQSLEILTETRSHDKKTTLLNFIVQTLSKNFPELLSYYSDLCCIEKASLVSLDNIQTDVQELIKGLELVKREYNIRQELKNAEISSVSQFLAENEEKIQKLIKDAKATQEAFNSCVEYYGDVAKMQTPSSFFGTFVKFQKAFLQAKQDLREKCKAEIEPCVTTPHRGGAANNHRKTNRRSEDELINEIRERSKMVDDKKPIRRTEVTEGTIEFLLDGLKKTPYIRADAVRRNRRRTQELSKEISRDICRMDDDMHL